jgi:hypothetical protein
MKLKCDKHKRRVMRVAETHFTHRSDGTKCASPTATIGTQTYTPNSSNLYLQAVKNHPEGEELLKDIFMDPAQRHSLYKCPFCKLEIEDGIDNLIIHRKLDGECEREQIKNNPTMED